MFFKFKAFQGPASYSFKDPDTGYIYRETSKQELISRITAYRAQNNLEPIEHLPFTIENYLCGLPENTGKCEPVELKRGLMGTLRGGIALLKNYMYQSFASQEVADERAKQCSQCKYNVFPDKGAFIEWSDHIAINSVGDRKTALQEELGSCIVCSCVVKAKVWYTGEVPAVAEQLPKFEEVACWQLKLMK